MAPKPQKRTSSRYKVLCLECNQSFDNDYRLKHNRLHHSELLKQHKVIRWQKVDAPKNPFEAAASSRRPAKVPRTDSVHDDEPSGSHHESLEKPTALEETTTTDEPSTSHHESLEKPTALEETTTTDEPSTSQRENLEKPTALEETTTTDEPSTSQRENLEKQTALEETTTTDEPSTTPRENL
jgi:uncharacterized UBP type Zn finger protein